MASKATLRRRAKRHKARARRTRSYPLLDRAITAQLDQMLKTTYEGYLQDELARESPFYEIMRRRS